MCLSSDGSLWIGTGGGGVNKISLKKTKFQHYKFPGNLLANFIWAIFEDKTGRIWRIHEIDIDIYFNGNWEYYRPSHELFLYIKKLKEIPYEEAFLELV